MSRNTMLKRLADEGKSEEQMLEALIKGEADVAPVKGDTPELAARFAKLILGKFKKQQLKHVSTTVKNENS